MKWFKRVCCVAGIVGLGSVTQAWDWTRVITFEEPVITSDSTIINQYEGVTFLGQVRRYEPSASPQSAPYVVFNSAGELSNPEALRFRLDPPQGLVRVYVGQHINAGSSVQAVIRGYYYNRFVIPPTPTRVLLTSNSVTIPPNGSVVTLLQIERTEQDINEVEIQFSGGGYEMIDSLEIGPNPTGTLPDTTAPAISVDSLPAYASVMRVGNDPYTNLVVTGSIVEDRALVDVRLCARNIAPGQGSTNSVVLTGGLPNFRYSGSVRLYPGTNLVWAQALDRAGNPGRTPDSLVVLDYPVVEVTNVTPLSGTPAYLLRQNPEIRIHPGGQNVTVRGRNLHTNLSLDLDIEGRQYSAPAISVTPDGSSATFSLPQAYYENAMNHGKTSWVAVASAWPGNYRVIWTGNYALSGEPAFPKLYGFGFKNVDRTISMDMFDGTYGQSAYMGPSPCRVIRPDYLILLVAYKIALGVIQGSCVGFASTSGMMYDYSIAPDQLDPNVFYPAGFTEPGWGGWTYSRCLGINFRPAAPRNLWAHIHSNHGVQITGEFLAAVLTQVRWDWDYGGITGYPDNVLAALRDNPTAYVLNMTPSVGSGHSVIPYKVVGNRVYVYDSNAPYRNWWSENVTTNRWALDSYVDFFPTPTDTAPHGTYSFPNLGGLFTNKPDGIYLAPLSVWKGRRTGPGIAGPLTEVLSILLCGSMAHCSAGGSNELGYQEDGTYVENLPGATRIPLMGSDGEGGPPFVFIPMNLYTQIVVTARADAGGRHLTHFANNGRQMQVDVSNSSSGRADQVQIGLVSNRLERFLFTPSTNGLRFIPRISVTSNDTDVTSYVWSGLTVPGGASIGFEMLEGSNGVDLINLTGQDQSPTLVISACDSNNAFTRVFESIPIRSNSLVRFSLLNWPESSQLQLEHDDDIDGSFDRSQQLAGTPGRAEEVPGSLDEDGNGIADAVDILCGFQNDANCNGMADDLETDPVSLSRYTAEVPQSGITRALIGVSVPATYTWSVVNTNSAWLGLTNGLTVTGPTNLAFYVDGNFGAARTAVVQVAGMQFSVRQAGGSMSITPAAQELPASGGEVMIIVTAPEGRPWGVTPDNDWISVSGSSSGIGNGTTQVSVASNSEGDRNASVRIGDQILWIDQDGVLGTLSHDSIGIQANGGSFVVDVVARTSLIWTVDEELPWVWVMSPLTNNGEARVQIAVDGLPLGNSDPPRTGTVTIAGQPFRITQEGTLLTFLPGQVEVPSSGAMFWVDLQASPSVGWDVVSSNEWIHLYGETNGYGQVQIQMSADGQTGLARTGSVHAGGATVEILQAGAETDIELSMAASHEIPVEGGTPEFVIKVHNIGPNPAAGVWVQDRLPAGVNFISAQTAAGSAELNGDQLDWIIETLAVGETAILYLQVSPQVTGQVVNVATALVMNADVELANNGASTSMTVIPSSSFGNIFQSGTLRFESGVFRFLVATVHGYTYEVECKDTLEAEAWIPFASFTGNGLTQVIADPDAPSDRRFYRVRVTTTTEH